MTSLSSASPSSGLGRRSQKSINEFARRIDAYLDLLDHGLAPTVPRPFLMKMLRFDPLLRLHPFLPKLVASGSRPGSFKPTVSIDLPPWKRRRRDAIEEEAFKDRCRILRESLILNGGGKC